MKKLTLALASLTLLAVSSTSMALSHIGPNCEVKPDGGIICYLPH